MHIGTTTIVSLLEDRFLARIGSAMRRRAQAKNRLRGIVAPIDDMIGISLFTTGSFQQPELEGVLDYVQRQEYPEDAVCIDVGAKIGVFSILMKSYFHRIYAFEPDELTFGVLKSNLGLTETSNTIPVHLTLADLQSRASVVVSGEDDEAAEGEGDATADDGEDDFSVETVQINRETLDRYLEQEEIAPEMVRFLRVDVPDMELKILQGAQYLLRRRKPTLLCNIGSAEEGSALFNYLKGFDYRNYFAFRRSYLNVFDPQVVPVPIDPRTEDVRGLVLIQ